MFMKKVTTVLIIGVSIICSIGSTTGFAADTNSTALAIVNTQESKIILENDRLAFATYLQDNKATGMKVHNKLTNRQLDFGQDLFQIVYKGGTILSSSEMIIEGKPIVKEIGADSKATKNVDRLNGHQITIKFARQSNGLGIAWKGIVHDGSNYIRQEVALEANMGAKDIERVILVNADIPNAKVVGTVKGSPIVADNLFYSVEHPQSDSEVKDGVSTCYIARTNPIPNYGTATYSSVIGVCRRGQIRRDFNSYVEMERARPFKLMVNYNTWWNIGYFTKFNEADALNVIETYGKELKKRGTALDSVLFDDGWDDTNSLWQFHDGFPNGFTKVSKACKKYGAEPGVWFSPFGGYGAPRTARLKAADGKYETNTTGFALAGPKYYKHFLSMCKEMINKYDINHFKFDGLGRQSPYTPGSKFGNDFEAAISIIEELRKIKPSLYINLTTGTWASPFWTRYADSIYRGSWDHEFCGEGNHRQQWLNFRDGTTHEHIVKGGPLFPVNSLMLCTIVYAKKARWLADDPGNDLADEIWSGLGSGTQMQELYISPDLLTKKNWDDLADAIKWTKANEDILVDTHWIGGDPYASEVYGWAAWTPRKGTLVLRNPSASDKTFSLDIDNAFELPVGAATNYKLTSVRKDKKNPPLNVEAGTPRTIELKPFEVLVFDAFPVNQK